MKNKVFEGLQTNIFNKISSSSIQTLVIPIPPKQEQSEQPVAEQTTRPVVPEQDFLNAEPHTSTAVEQIKSFSTEQDTLAMPPVEDLIRLQLHKMRATIMELASTL